MDCKDVRLDFDLEMTSEGGKLRTIKKKSEKRLLWVGEGKLSPSISSLE